MIRSRRKRRLKRSDYPKDWPIISRALRKARPFCESCGLPVRPYNLLTVHHLNGNPQDCRMGNLAVLCQKCHLKHQNSGIPCVSPRKIHQESFKLAQAARS